MKKNEDASCLVKNNPKIMKDLREVLPELRVIFDSDDNDAINTLKANIKEFAKSIIKNQKDKEAGACFRAFYDEKGKCGGKKIKILMQENKDLVEELRILAEENKKLKKEKENLEEEKEELKNYISCGHKNKMFIYYYGN